jgi:hypothetical protein
MWNVGSLFTVTLTLTLKNLASTANILPTGILSDSPDLFFQARTYI